MRSAWEWFLSNGGPHAVLWVFVSVFVGAIARAILHELRRIADYLDTHTKGGLHDVIEALERPRRRAPRGRPPPGDP